MTALPTWVALSLSEALDERGFVDRARRLGVSADVTRDGIHLAGRFLARIEPAPFPANLADASLAEEPLAMGSATLHLSGGTIDLARQEHQQPEALREMRRDMATRMAAATGLPDTGRIESAASAKMTALTELTRALTPLSTAVILPRANHIALPARAFEHEAASFLDGRSYTFPLWAYLKVREDADVNTIATVGMWPFGLPDVAMPWPRGADRDARVQAIGELQREMVAEGWWPETGQTFPTSKGELRLERVWSAVWASFPSDAPAPAARARFGHLAQLLGMVGPATHNHMPLDEGGPAIEHLRRPSDVSYAVTNGISDAPQRGGTPEAANDLVELVVASRALGPWADGWLRWAASYITSGDGTHPIVPFDRLVLPEPRDGLAAAIVWPMGHLNAETAGGPTTQLWELVPVTTEEVRTFRAQPGSQAEWVDERLARRDLDAIQARWTTNGRDA